MGWTDGAVSFHAGGASAREGLCGGQVYKRFEQEARVDVGVGMERDVVEEDDAEAEADHVSIVYFLLREDPSVISGLG